MRQTVPEGKVNPEGYGKKASVKKLPHLLDVVQALDPKCYILPEASIEAVRL